MIAALLGLLFLAGGAGSALLEYLDELQDDVKTVIADSERRAQATAVLKRFEDRVDQREDDISDTTDQLIDLIADHAVTDAALDAVWQADTPSADAYHRDMIDLRFELKQHITREEWAELFAEQ